VLARPLRGIVSTRLSRNRIRGVTMIVIVGLVVLLVAVIIGITGVLAHAGVAHPLTGKFEVLGYHVTGSTGTLFLVGIVIGALRCWD
jgi:hypothetical protein